MCVAARCGVERVVSVVPPPLTTVATHPAESGAHCPAKCSMNGGLLPCTHHHPLFFLMKVLTTYIFSSFSLIIMNAILGSGFELHYSH